jgi:RNA recognition motif-containing protein
MSNLLLSNLPYNASDREIREWIESRGIGTKSIRIVRDVGSGVSPAFGHVELKDGIELEEAISILDGKRMRNHTVLAKEVPAYAPRRASAH